MSLATASRVDTPEVLLGPCACSECHVPLFMFHGTLGEPRWLERHWRHDRNHDLKAEYRPHECTARTHIALPPGTFDTVMEALADRRR